MVDIFQGERGLMSLQKLQQGCTFGFVDEFGFVEDSFG